MKNVLEKIIEKKKDHVRRQKKSLPISVIERNINFVSKPAGFANALKKKAKKNEVGLIAEVKKASPSKGIIRKDFDPVKIAKEYQRAGATCISVLTDYPYFMGRDEYLTEVKKEVRLPVLRKDFMMDPYQIYESRVLGADCILLIMAALSDNQAAELENIAFELGMDVLVEVHDRKELNRALRLQSELLGINNRNLKTLQVDISTTIELKEAAPDDKIVICESGISTNADIRHMVKNGVSSFLVGESLTRQPDIYKATKALLGLKN